MNKILNILTIIFGVVLTISGIVKLTGSFDQFTLTYGDYYLTMHNYTWTVLVLLIDLGGGISMMLHGALTLNFKPENINTQEDLIDAIENLENITLSRTAGITGSLSLLSCAFILLWLIVSLSGIPIGQFITIVLILVGIIGTLVTIPSILVLKNLNLNNRIRNKIKAKKLAEFHAKRQASGQTRRK